jgi:hypothetical protein
MPIVPALPVVTAACFFACRRATGAAGIRHSLRPLYFRGDKFAKLGQILLRERGAVTLLVIARSVGDEAIHGATSGDMDCFASLAITTSWSPRPVWLLDSRRRHGGCPSTSVATSVNEP